MKTNKKWFLQQYVRCKCHGCRMINRSDKKPLWSQLKTTSDWLLMKSTDNHMMSYCVKIGRAHFKLHENEAQTASSLPRAPSKQGCTCGQETPFKPSTLHCRPSIWSLYLCFVGEGGRWTPPATHSHPRARPGLDKAGAWNLHPRARPAPAWIN